ncbi:hypothetical protein ACWCQQ_19085 [Streptomyces sp. NPDC002143]
MEWVKAGLAVACAVKGDTCRDTAGRRPPRRREGMEKALLRKDGMDGSKAEVARDAHT